MDRGRVRDGVLPHDNYGTCTEPAQYTLCPPPTTAVTSLHFCWHVRISGTGKGGECVWGGKFEDEFHPELRVSHRRRAVGGAERSTPCRPFGCTDAHYYARAFMTQ